MSEIIESPNADLADELLTQIEVNLAEYVSIECRQFESLDSAKENAVQLMRKHKFNGHDFFSIEGDFETHSLWLLR